VFHKRKEGEVLFLKEKRKALTERKSICLGKKQRGVKNLGKKRNGGCGGEAG